LQNHLDVPGIARSVDRKEAQAGMMIVTGATAPAHVIVKAGAVQGYLIVMLRRGESV